MKIPVKNFIIDAYVRGNRNAQKCALVLPGYLDTKDYAHIRSHVDFLATKGFYAIGVDMPGTWGSGDDISEYTFTNCLQAVMELLQEFGRPTILVGHSNGGRLALLAAQKSEHVIGAVAIMSPLYIVRSTSKKERILQWKNEGVRRYKMDLPDNPEQFREFNVPFSYIEDSEKYQLSQVLSRIDVPKLFIAGSDDHVIPLSEVQKAYERAVQQKQFETVESGHIYRHDAGVIEDINSLIGSFIALKIPLQ